MPVLAWLDYCVQNDLSFRDTVLEHLKAFRKATTGEEYLFTNRQVDQKLIETGRHMSSHPSLLEIRQNGTACYRELPKDTKEKVQVALARYYELYRGDVPEQYLLSRSLTEVDATSPTPQREEMEVTDKCNEEEPGRNRENVSSNLTLTCQTSETRLILVNRWQSRRRTRQTQHRIARAQNKGPFWPRTAELIAQDPRLEQSALQSTGGKQGWMPPTISRISRACWQKQDIGRKSNGRMSRSGLFASNGNKRSMKSAIENRD